MSRAQVAWRFVAHGGVIADKGSHRRSCSHEVDADPPSHTVTDDSCARAIDFFSFQEVAPALIDNLHELAVGGLLLYVGVIRKAEELVEIRHDRRVSELGEITGDGFEVAGDAVVVVDD